MSSVAYTQHKDIIFRQEEDEAILFNPDNSEIVVINSTGCFIWDLCNGKNSQEEIAGHMVKEFDTTIEKATEDTARFLLDLEKKQFIEKI